MRVNNFDEEVTTPLKEWISVLKTSEIPESYTAQGLKEAREVLRVDSLSEEDRKAYFRYLESLSLSQSVLWSSRVLGFDEGEKIGREKGRTEQLVESVKKFISKGYDFDEVVKILEVPLDQIPELRHLIFNN